MASENQAQISNLIMARMSTAAELSAWLMGVVASNLDSQADIAGWASSQRLMRRMEGQSVSLYMRGGGCTWDFLGSNVGVTRQSLHRRLARPAAREFEQAQRILHTPSEDLDQRIDSIRQHLRALHREAVQPTLFATQQWEDYRANQPQSIIAQDYTPLYPEGGG
jgi:hypothetical protein